MEVQNLLKLINKKKIKDSDPLFKDNEFIIDDNLLIIFSKVRNYLYNNYIKREKLFKLVYHKEYLILNNIYVTRDGIIQYKNNYYYDGQPWEITRIKNNSNLTESISIENQVISIAKLYSAAYYHFTIQCFMSLANIPNELLINSKIHIGNGKYHHRKFIVEMFKLINIEEKQLIFGDIYASKIYIPIKNNLETLNNIHCYEWYKKIINTYLHSSNTHKYVLLVKRCKRGLDNFDEIKTYLSQFSIRNNLKLLIHDDANLPSIIEQFNIFNQSKYVFAPHGASGMFIPAMKKDSWYMDFIKKEWYNESEKTGGGELISKIAYACGINYYMSISDNDKLSMCKLISITEKIVNTNI